MKMEFLTSMLCCSSRESSKPETNASSTWYPKPGQHITIQTFRRLRAPPMLNNTWRKTESSLIMELSKSMEDQLEEVSNLPTMLTPRQSMHLQNPRRSIF
ncbi:AC4 protein [Cajanus scarabaeoides yellow mosaic virus]|uniref:AC4 protein n=1 Tax=Cajanus scarabaeoides yellow mosaic virus TaxID=3000307 RepID=A0A9E8MHD4_9GEMI|nr:AC4 protein [Cajanus scarabaeoides yellow mosaic virus]